MADTNCKLIKLGPVRTDKLGNRERSKLFVTTMASKRGPEWEGSEESKKRRRVAFDQVAYSSIPVTRVPDVMM